MTASTIIIKRNYKPLWTLILIICLFLKTYWWNKLEIRCDNVVTSQAWWQRDKKTLKVSKNDHDLWLLVTAAPLVSWSHRFVFSADCLTAGMYLAFNRCSTCAHARVLTNAHVRLGPTHSRVFLDSDALTCCCLQTKAGEYDAHWSFHAPLSHVNVETLTVLRSSRQPDGLMSRLVWIKPGTK